MGSLKSRKERETNPQGAVRRRDAWELAKEGFLLRKESKGHILLSCRSLGNAGTLFRQSQKRDIFVVDSGASMHMLSKKDLRAQESWRLSRDLPLTVATANGRSRRNVPLLPLTKRVPALPGLRQESRMCPLTPF